MQAVFPFVRRQRWLLLLLLLLALAAGAVWGGIAWLPMLAAPFTLGRSYGAPAAHHDVSAQAQYGVGAALTGFTPPRRE